MSDRPAAAPTTEEDAIVEALEAQDLELVDAVPLAVAIAPEAPGDAARRRQARSAAASSTVGGEVDIDVPLRAHESAVVLVERDGVYEWHFIAAESPATPALAAPGDTRRRRGTTPHAARSDQTRTAHFKIPLPSSSATAATRRPARRGGLSTRGGLGNVVTYVFRFVAKPVLGVATRFMERNVREGLVLLTKPDPKTWTTLAEDAAVATPSGRPARVLLLVHGTFSSTVGSFGALASTTAGRDFLEAALKHYDLVIGWDHRTLSALPTENAIDLASRLERVGFEEPPHVDAVAYSRGGLVLRSLIEHVLPASRWRLATRRAVFVACTNGGTELAKPANWHRFADRYTNLAAAGARAAALMPGFASAGLLLAAAIRGVGVFVKALASAVVTDNAVPGISAMAPDGAFVRDINEQQPGQPLPSQTYYCAITSNFDPDTAAAQTDPSVMPPGLLLKLADKATDALFGKPNDLVVHVDSMTQIDEALGAYVRDRHEFGTNGTVHHCAYFNQPQTASALSRWLELPSASPPVRRGRQPAAAKRRPPAPSSKAVRAASGHPDAPSGQLVTLRSSLSAADAIARLEDTAAPWVVVERPFKEKGKAVTLHYAHPTRSGLGWLRASGPNATVLDAFNLRETARSSQAPAGVLAPSVELPTPRTRAELDTTFGSRFRTVLLDRGQPVAVVSSAEEQAASAHGFPQSPGIGRQAPGAGQRTARRRGERGKVTVEAGQDQAAANAPSPPAPASDQGDTGAVACHFRADSDDEIVVAQVHTVAVTISREALAATAGKQSKLGKAPVKKNKKLVVECLPMLRLTMADPDDARVQIPVPEPGKPAEVRFDVVGQETGQAEVRVQIRQGPLPLVTLTLTPTVVAARSGTRRLLQAKAELADLPALPRANDELRIIQLRPTGRSTQYRFDLSLPGKKVLKSFESPLLDSDPSAYVSSLHKRIEDRWTEHASERAAFERDLRAIGADLFDELFPLELRQLLWRHREDIRSVQVLSSEPFIPWELVHVRDPAARTAGPDSAFLGEFGVVRWLFDGYPPEKLRLRQGMARYVVPTYPPPDELPDAQREISLVAESFGAKPVSPQAEAVYRLIEKPGQFDLLHIACHGLADQDDIDSARLEMPGKLRSDKSMSEEHVLATTVRREAQLEDGDWRPIVVLNACQSVRGGYSLKGIGGFAPAFIQGGAGVVVGSGWSVGDKPAFGFIEEFYARLFDARKPEPLARAAAAARKKARDEGDATWLAYVVYGHPRAVVSTR